MFGRNPCLWIVPWMGKAGKPDGSGVIWPLKNGNTSVNEDPGVSDDIVKLSNKKTGWNKQGCEEEN